MAGIKGKSGRYPKPENNPEYLKIISNLKDGTPKSNREIFGIEEYKHNPATGANDKPHILTIQEGQYLKNKSKMLYWLEKEQIIKSSGSTNKRKYNLDLKGLLFYLKKNYFPDIEDEIKSENTIKLFNEYLNRVFSFDGYEKYSLIELIENFIMGIGRYVDQKISLENKEAKELMSVFIPYILDFPDDFLENSNPLLKQKIPLRFAMLCWSYYHNKTSNPLNFAALSCAVD
jgi:hypothetical protein